MIKKEWILPERTHRVTVPADDICATRGRLIDEAGLKPNQRGNSMYFDDPEEAAFAKICIEGAVWERRDD